METAVNRTLAGALTNNNRILIRLLGAAVFLVMFQAYLVAPLIPSLTQSFHTSRSLIGLAIPMFTIPYGLSSLFYGPLSDRFGRKTIILGLLAFLAISIVLLGCSKTAVEFLVIRALTGIATGGIVPISIALIGDIYPYEKRGKPIGMLFSAMAGGMAVGSTLGAYLNPIIGWPMEFIITGMIGAVLFFIGLLNPGIFKLQQPRVSVSVKNVFKNSVQLLTGTEGRKVYSFIFFNGVFHSGVFAWLGYYFAEQYHLGDQGIGLALLGYGLPGMMMGVAIGKAADRFGRKKIVPAGLLLGSLMVLILVFKTPLWAAGAAVAFLSLGYDMTQPLFAGMVSELGQNAMRGQAMGLGACLLFLGYGIGALIFQLLLNSGLSFALSIFVILELFLFVCSLRYFKHLSNSSAR